MHADTLPSFQRAFADFRADPTESLRVDAARYRAGQIRALLAHPLRIDVADFEREVWHRESAVLLNRHGGPLSDTEIQAFRAAMADGSLEIRGNPFGRPGGAFCPTEPDAGTRRATVRAAVQVLNAPEMSPAEKAQHLEALPGFAPDIATGLVTLFHPDAFAPRNDASIDQLRRLGYAADTAASFQAAARELLQALGATDFLELDAFLNQATPSKPAPARRIVKIAPGDGARFWPECLAGGYICVGWDDVGDLNDYPDKAALSDAFERLYDYTPSKRTAKVNELWTLRVLLPGDIVVANRGTREVLAVGRVTEPGYVYQPSRAEYRHTVAVTWDTSRARTVPRQGHWALQTIAPVPPDLYQALADGDPLPTQAAGRVAEGGGGYAYAEPSRRPLAYREPDFETIRARVRSAGLSLADRDLRRYHISLKTRGFVVLSGLSGTGKTWLAEAYADALGARALLVAVAPNWNTNEDLLGYHNPLTQKHHDTSFSAFLREAADDYRRARRRGQTPRPYHLILDEMNLARVEHYFARFLSALETRARHADGAFLDLGPNDRVALPPTLCVIGTVNMDETTHGFADKVYDRAQVLELGVTRDQLQAHLGDAPYADRLLAVWSAVQGVAPFAFRVLDEIGAYVREAQVIGVPWTEALDEQILQKVLPKLKGADPTVGQALSDLLPALGDACPLSREKAEAMRAAYKTYGIAAFF